jgi:hypothetical protein
MSQSVRPTSSQFVVDADALIQSLSNEFQHVYKTKLEKGQQPWELPHQKRRATVEGTIFEQHFLTVTMDEAHNARNLGVNYFAPLRIFQQAVVKLALTGTPLLTGPKVTVFFVVEVCCISWRSRISQ